MSHMTLIPHLSVWADCSTCCQSRVFCIQDLCHLAISLIVSKAWHYLVVTDHMAKGIIIS